MMPEAGSDYWPEDDLLSATLPEEAEDGDVDDVVDPLAGLRGADDAGQNSAQAPQQRTKLCLVVDDSRVIRKLTGAIASNLGFKVVEAQDGEEALARCRQRMPDLVLTDWQMPEMDGIAFVTALRAMPASITPKIVFCTSKGEGAHVDEGIAAGADDYVIKPFDERALRAKLQRLGIA